jgi:hypothetical protein
MKHPKFYTNNNYTLYLHWKNRPTNKEEVSLYIDQWCSRLKSGNTLKCDHDVINV